MAANGYGILLGALAMCKGYWAPSHPEDVKISGTMSSSIDQSLRANTGRLSSFRLLGGGKIFDLREHTRTALTSTDRAQS